MSGEVKNADFKQTKQKKTTTKQTKKLRFFSAQIKKNMCVFLTSRPVCRSANVCGERRKRNLSI